MKYILGFIVSVGFLLITPSFVYAATYYASPNGTGTCAESSPCSLNTGYGKLVNGDTLYLRGGTYAQFLTISKSDITISGYPGETALMDGTSLNSNSGYAYLITINGSNNTIQNLELTNPNARGIMVSRNSSTDAAHNTLRGLNIHHIWGPAISDYGSYILVENNTIWKTNLSNANQANGDWPGVIVIGITGQNQYGVNAIVRNNKVYDNYGEGIMTEYSDNALIEGNVVYNNWAESIYIANSSYATVRNNLIYYTTDKEYWRDSTMPDAGVMIADENQNPGAPIGRGIKVYNNIIVNTGHGIYFWTGYAPGAGLIDDVIANNTIVSNYAYYGIDIGSGSHQNTIFENNIILDNSGTPLSIPSMTGFTFTNNLWSKKPSNFSTSDFVGDPLLVNSGQSVDAGIDANWYKLTANSPAINKALSLTDVTTDYFGTTRPQGVFPDIGAHEYATSQLTPTPSIPPPTPSPTLAPKPGDANGDGLVNEADYAIWLAHYTQHISGGASVGDFNGDGTIDGIDYTIWVNNFGK